MQESEVSISPQDILAAISFEAQRIVAATSQHAAGYNFPNPKQIQEIITRMAALNSVLVENLTFDDHEPHMQTTSDMKVQLN